MSKFRRNVGCLAIAGFWLAPVLAQKGNGPTPAHKSCTVSLASVPAPSAADQALGHARFDEAERLYAAMPVSDSRTVGLVRAELGQHKLDAALALAEKENAAHPNDAMLLDLVGEVRYRRGEVEEAATAFNQSSSLDPCLARTRYDVGRYLNLNGMYASAQRQLDYAYKLAPQDPQIKRTWERSQRVPLTPDQQMERLRQRESEPNLSDEQKTALANSIKAIQAQSKGDCTLAAPVTSAKVPMYATNGSNVSSRPPTSSGVDVLLNGKRRRFLLDTGASGLMLTRGAAKALSLTPEAEVKTGGLGDEGSKDTFLAHVDHVKIGSMEFSNCMLRVLEKDPQLGIDGLLGPDIFRSFVVTLDFPGSELRLSPLPPRPDETAETPTLGTDGDAAGATAAQTRKDRYVAPEMANWDKVFRFGHQLIVPTYIGKAPVKLFILDTGAGQNLISQDAAREVTKVHADDGGRVRGISGDVNHVAGTDSLFIQFAGVRQQIAQGLNAIDTSQVSRGTGVEISGFIGYPILHQLVIQIDYRDDLVHVSYSPHLEPGLH